VMCAGVQIITPLLKVLKRMHRENVIHRCAINTMR
jgi:hypothetical protein